MKISKNWLSNYLELNKTNEEIEQALTLIGFEVEGIDEWGLPDLPEVVVGEVLRREPHPDADRLSVCSVLVKDGEEPSTIVCGADNYKVGDRVPVALPGAVLPGGFKIKAAKLRGVMSQGMMCSGREIGYGTDGKGLLILSERPAVGTPINQVFPDPDVIFDVEVTPNRPDCLSYVGIARELAAYFRLDFNYPDVENFPEPSGDYNPDTLLKGITLDAEEDCPHYTAWRIAGVKVEPSPSWLVQNLRSIGLRPINNVVDITNFVLHELGQPLHAFDAAKIEGRRLIIRHAADGEKIFTLDGKQRTLRRDMTVIADAKKALVVAGVMGSEDAEVDEKTIDIVLESAYFRPSQVRSTARRLGLSTDSSYRFERGVDPRGIGFAAERAIGLILQYAGGELLPPRLEVGAPFHLKREIELTRPFLDQRAGYPIPNREVEEIFTALELNFSARVHREGTAYWNVEIPSFRGDLDSPIDLVEEIVRMYGTDRIPAGEVRGIGLTREDDAVARANRRFGQILVGQSYQECLTYTLRSGEELKKWYRAGGAEALGVMNPLSVEQSHLRWSLIPGLLETLRLNAFRKTGMSRVFETGHTYYERDGAVVEANSVSFVHFLSDQERAWRKLEAPDFFSAKSLIRQLASSIQIDLEQYPINDIRLTNSAWQDGHSAMIGDLVDYGFEARFGLINLALAKTYDLEGVLVAGVLSATTRFLERDCRPPVYQPINHFPAAERDLAVVVPQQRQAGEVAATLQEFGREESGHSLQMESVKLFDCYEGKGLPEGHKSLAFTFSFRAEDRTLTDDEVNEVFRKIQFRVTQTKDLTIRG